MPSTTFANSVLHASYVEALADAIIALQVMRDLPPEFDPVKELAQALERVIEAVRALDLPLGSSVELLDAIAAGGQS
jgi:hypothetical protein